MTSHKHNEITPSPACELKTVASCVIKSFESKIISWSYHSETRLLVIGGTKNFLYFIQFEKNGEIGKHYSNFLCRRHKGRTGIISIDFDLFKVSSTQIRCILSNYDSDSNILDIYFKSKSFEIKQTPIPEKGFGQIINRSIVTLRFIILIGESVQIYTSEITPKLIAQIESEEFKDDFGNFIETIKVGEVFNNTLFISSHEGKFFQVKLPDSHEDKTDLKPIFIKNVYADVFKIWNGYLVASNHKKRIMTLHNMNNLSNVIKEWQIQSLDPTAEYPYPSIGSDEKILTIPSTPTVTIFVELNKGKLIETEMSMVNDLSPIVTPFGILSVEKDTNIVRHPF